MDNEKIEDIICRRIWRRLSKTSLYKLKLGKFYIAGESILGAKPKDISIFPIEKYQFNNFSSDTDLYEIIFRTKNAKTLKLAEGTIIQLCNYHHNSLRELVDSFDFAHIKIGATINFESKICHSGAIEEIYISDDFELSKINESIFYTEFEYFFSSLIRTLKYYERGEF